MSKDYFIIPIFVPHYGCPHDCVFCNQKKITGFNRGVNPEFIRKTIEEHLATFPKGHITVEVAFYGGSFTGIEKTIQRELLAVPFAYKVKGKVHGIRLSTRPDYIDEDVLNLLKEYSVDTIELGVQSLDDGVLKKSGRGHNSQQVYVASKLIKENGFNLGLQMMVGLVDDSEEKAMFTGKEFVKLNPYCVRIYPVLVIRDTALENMYRRNIYKPISLEKAVKISAHLLMMFEYYNIDVIRIGLQPTENIRPGKDVVAGPFHPSIRQLVESSIYRIVLDKHLKGLEWDVFNSNLVLRIENRDISNLVGQKSENIEYFLKKYRLKSVKVYGEDIGKDIIGVSLGGSNSQIFKKKAIEEYLRRKKIINY